MLFSASNEDRNPGRTARRLAQLSLVALLAILSACALPGGAAEPVAMSGPQAAGAQGVIAQNAVIAASHDAAAEAGLAMLRSGGNAVDAAVATAFALGVVEPNMISVGGGGALLVWMAEEGAADYLEFYSAAAGARGGRDRAQHVAVPGKVAGLLEAHERYGVLSREAVMEPAIDLARYGFPVHARLASSIASNEEKITHHQDAADIFFPAGEALEAGDRLVQPSLARTLERISREGREGFYRGPTARALVDDLAAGENPMTLDDLSGFEPRWQRPLCGEYRGYTVLTAPPPLGGVEVLQTLALLERHDFASLGPPYADPAAAGLLTDALRTARTDRAAWIADPDTPLPARGFTAPEYVEERAAMIGADVVRRLPAGDPRRFEAAPQSASCEPLDPYAGGDVDLLLSGGNGGSVRVAHLSAETVGPGAESTTHLSVVDADRNAVGITMTIGPAFGGGFYSGGAFFNNAITRFGSTPEANQWAPFRTPRSSTAPTIVLEDGEVRLVTGAQGGTRIPGAVVHNIVYALDHGMSASEAMAAPRLFPLYVRPELHMEAAFSGEVLAALRDRGYEIVPRSAVDSYLAGAHMVVVLPDGRIAGSADPRRSGSAVGY